MAASQMDFTSFEFWMSLTSHAPTKMVLDVALGQFAQMDPCNNERSPFTPREYLEQMAAELVSGEREFTDAEDGEMWPEWCNLVITPAINATLDWALIHRAVNERYNACCDEEDAREAAERAAAAEAVAPPPLDVLVLSLLSNQGKTVRELLVEVKKTYPTTTKTQVNQVLYKNQNALQASHKPSDNQGAPRWAK